MQIPPEQAWDMSWSEYLSILTYHYETDPDNPKNQPELSVEEATLLYERVKAGVTTESQ